MQSIAKYPSDWYINKIDSLNIDASELVLVNIYYDEMFYTSIGEDPALTLEFLLSAVGGNLGLFLGASLLTLMEFIEFFYYTIYYFIIKNKKDAVKRKKNFPFHKDP